MDIWMKVTKDEFELPVYVCDTAVELARLCGCSQNNIYSSISHSKSRRQKTQYVRVRVEEDE